MAAIDNIAAYNAIAARWHAYRSHRAVDNCVVQFCHHLPPHARVLDVGCGTGYPIDAYLLRQGYTVVGIDPSAQMLAYAVPLAGTNAVFCCVDLLGYKGEAPFDAIVAYDSLWHIDRAQQAAIYPKLASLLDEGGWLLMTHGKTAGEVQGTMFGQTFGYSALDMEEVVSLLARNGMQVEQIFQDYIDPTSGTRDLVLVAHKGRVTAATDTKEPK